MNIKFKKFFSIFTIFALAVSLTVFCGLSCIGPLYFTISDVAKWAEEWDVELPEDSELMFYSDNLGFTCDGQRYCIVGFEEEPTELIKDFSYKRNESDEEYLGKLIKRTLSEEQEADYLPDWEANHCYSGELKNEHNDRLYMLYYPESFQLFMVFYLI